MLIWFFYFLPFRPCFTAVEPLNDAEDRRAALNKIVSLSDELSSNSQLLARISRLDLNLSLLGLMETDANQNRVTMTTTTTTSGGKVALAGDGNAGSRRRPPIDGRVHASAVDLARCVSEAKAVSLDGATLAARLWALRQAVACYDARMEGGGTGLVKQNQGTSFVNDVYAPACKSLLRNLYIVIRWRLFVVYLLADNDTDAALARKLLVSALRLDQMND